MPTPEEIIASHDKDKRITEEKEILELIENAQDGDHEAIRRAQLWQIKETISQGCLLRTLVESLPMYQKKVDCMLSHTDKKMKVRLFGVTYALPVSIGLVCVCFLVFMFCRAQGWM